MEKLSNLQLWYTVGACAAGLLILAIAMLVVMVRQERKRRLFRIGCEKMVGHDWKYISDPVDGETRYRECKLCNHCQEYESVTGKWFDL